MTFSYFGGMIRIVHIACVVVTVAILWGVKSFLQATGSWGGPGFVDGALFGAGFLIMVYLLIIWIDPSSRPRGSSTKQD